MDRLTIPEYLLLMEAQRLRQVDLDYRCHLLAWLGFAARARKKKGQPVYRKFIQFFDYRKEIRKARGREPEQSRFAGIGQFLRKGEEHGGEF